MALYLGSTKKNLNVGSSSFRVNVSIPVIISNSILLKTLDNKILKDKNGIYITAKESE